jgi:hypothetical protein
MAVSYVHTFDMTKEEIHNREMYRKLYTYECWLPESVGGMDTLIFFDSLDEVPELYRDYTNQNKKELRG